MSDIFAPNEYSYERTHGFINWRMDWLDKLPNETWLALGEIRSKCEHLSLAPLRREARDNLYKVNLARGVSASAAIEGNSLSEDEVAARIDNKPVGIDSPEQHVREVDNLIGLSREILAGVITSGVTPLTPEWLVAINEKVLAGLPIDPTFRDANGYSTKTMGVRSYISPDHSNYRPLIDELCVWLNGDAWNFDRDNKISSGILKALVGHLYLLWIHPFPDGNGRTARLLEQRFLLECGVPDISIHLLSNHYNTTRQEYFDSVEMSHRDHVGHIEEFVEYAVRGILKRIREQTDIARLSVIKDVWKNVIHDAFAAEQGSVAKRRRRELALTLGFVKPLFRREIRRASPILAEMYAGKGPKTVARDINELLQMKLAKRQDGGIVGNLGLISDQLPYRHIED